MAEQGLVQVRRQGGKKMVEVEVGKVGVAFQRSEGQILSGAATQPLFGILHQKLHHQVSCFSAQLCILNQAITTSGNTTSACFILWYTYNSQTPLNGLSP